jgi:hypothetical protein
VAGAFARADVYRGHAAYEVASLDVTVITGADGNVTYRDAVPTTLDQLQDRLRRARAKV